MLRQLSAGIIWGLTLAVAYSALLLGTKLLPGSSTEFFAADPPYARYILSYFSGGLLAGLARGVLWPRARTELQAVLAGFATALPFFVAVHVAVRGWGEWSVLGAAELAIMAFIGGGLAVLILWRAGHTRV